jgi:hypothetical protein
LFGRFLKCAMQLVVGEAEGVVLHNVIIISQSYHRVNIQYSGGALW